MATNNSLNQNTTPTPLNFGGTNASLTASNGGIVYSSGTAMAILSGTATAGQIIRSGSSAAPTWSTSTYPATNAVSTLLYASSANVMAALATANGGVLVTNSTGVPSVAALTDGQIIIGATGGSAIAASLTAGTGITITPGTNSISIAATGAGMVWANISGTTQTAAVNSGYVVGNAAQTTVTLPTTAALGDRVRVAGKGAAGFILTAGAGQTINFGTSVTSTAGSLTSASANDSVEVVCVTANTTWSVLTAFTSAFTVA
jgi:hypothetical protein